MRFLKSLLVGIVAGGCSSSFTFPSLCRSSSHGLREAAERAERRSAPILSSQCRLLVFCSASLGCSAERQGFARRDPPTISIGRRDFAPSLFAFVVCCLGLKLASARRHVDALVF